MELQEAIKRRRSVRRYSNQQVTRDEINQLINAGLKVPSAGGIRPLKIVVIDDVNVKKELCKACLNQSAVENAQVCLVIMADTSRMVSKYHGRGMRYIYMEAGHAGQNISLTAVELGLGCVMIGAFRDEEVKKVVGVEGEPLYVIPIGKIDAV